MRKYDRHEIEIETMTWDDKAKVFVVEYSMYNNKGEHILTETTTIEHETDITDIYFDALEVLKKSLKGIKYGTKIKN